MKTFKKLRKQLNDSDCSNEASNSTTTDLDEANIVSKSFAVAQQAKHDSARSKLAAVCSKARSLSQKSKTESNLSPAPSKTYW